MYSFYRFFIKGNFYNLTTFTPPIKREMVDHSFKKFQEAIRFFEKLSFELFPYKDLEQFYRVFKREVEGRYREPIQKMDDIIPNMLFEYIGFDTGYGGFGLDQKTAICKQVWTFYPYLEDFEDEYPIDFILDNLNRMVANKLPISIDDHFKSGDFYTIHFSIGDKTFTIPNQLPKILGYMFIGKIVELSKGDNFLDTFYLFNFDPAILFTCKVQELEQLKTYLEIEDNL